MNRLFVLAGALALGVILTATVQGQDGKTEKKVPSIKKVMSLTHGKTGFKSKFEKAVKAENWKEAAKIAKDWEACAENLAKNEPPKGSKEDWEKITGSYVKTIKTLEEASEKQETKRVHQVFGHSLRHDGSP